MQPLCRDLRLPRFAPTYRCRTRNRAVVHELHYSERIRTGLAKPRPDGRISFSRTLLEIQQNVD